MQTITLTSKGQITLPIGARRALNIKRGDKLTVVYNPIARFLTIRKPITIQELSTKISGYAKRTIEPITNVDEYYQRHRLKKL